MKAFYNKERLKQLKHLIMCAIIDFIGSNFQYIIIRYIILQYKSHNQ